MITIDQSEVTAEVAKLMEAGNFGGASALLRLASTNSTDTAEAETVTPLVKEGKQEGAKKVSVTVKKAKKAKRYTHAHKGVQLTTRQWVVWLAVKALLDAKRELAAGSKGFYSLSGKFVATFMGTPFWTKKEVDRVNAVMRDLRRKGLLAWVSETIGKSKRKIKGNIAFGPKA